MSKALFLNLTAFSGTGGLEKFNRCFLKAIHELKGAGNTASYSAYDTVADERYYPRQQYRGFAGRRILFIINSFFKAARYDEIILGHINLALAGYLIKTVYPSKKIILITHGIEVWELLGGFKKKMLQKADGILSVSAFTKNKMAEVQQISADKVQIFPNTIDPYFPVPQTFEGSSGLRSKYGVGEHDFVLFTLARLSSREQYKGYDIVIECLPALLKKIPGIKYVIAGKYDEAEKQRVENMIAKLHLEDNVILTGFIDDSELTAHYQMSNLFIMPSKGEGFGIVFLEAMVCGLSVMAGNKDGSVDALQNGALGMLVNPDDKNEIVEKVVSFYNGMAGIDINSKHALQEKVIRSFGFTAFKDRLKNILAHNFTG